MSEAPVSNFYGYGKAALTSKKDDWETPQYLFDELNSKYNFNWDLAASDTNHKTDNYFNIEDDSLSQDWSKLKGNLFLNPPYGRQLRSWAEKAQKTKLKPGQRLVMLIPARTDTSYWHDFIFDHASIEFLRGRLKFEQGGIASNPATFGSAIVIYGGELV